MQQQLVSVSSKRRLAQSSSSTNFTVKLPHAVTDVKKVMLREVLMPNTLYNIRSGVNAKIDFNDGVNKTATLTPGNYSMSALMSHVLTQLNAVSSGFTAVTYSSTSLKVTIARSSIFNLLWASGANTAQSTAEILGFSATDLSAASTYTGDKAAGFFQPLSLFLAVDELGSPLTNTYGLLSTFKIPVTVGAEGLQVMADSQWYPQVVAALGKNIAQLTCRVFFENGEVVSLNGADWEMLLEVE